MVAANRAPPMNDQKIGKAFPPLRNALTRCATLSETEGYHHTRTEPPRTAP